VTRIPDYPYRENPITAMNRAYGHDPNRIPPLRLRPWLIVTLAFVLVTLVAIFVLNITSSGAGPDHQCRVELYPDHSWRPLGWTTRDNWPPAGCNFVVTVDQGPNS
jgi:uncharacterized BrkB/YihY/UPF0761 family membrane protein